MLPMAVAWCCPDNNAIYCVLPVLWMALCFHIMGQIQIQAIGKLFNVTRLVVLEVKSAIHELPLKSVVTYFKVCSVLLM